MEKDKKRTYQAPALVKGLEILELLAEARTPLSLTQITERLGKGKGELFRMAAVLEERGYLAKKEGSDNLNLTSKLFELGISVPPIGTLIEAAFPIMHKLSMTIMQACHIAVPNKDNMVVIASIESPSNVGMSVKSGHIMKLYESGSGLLFLSKMSEEKRNEMYVNFHELNEKFDEEKCKLSVEKINNKGNARVDSPITNCLVDISFPILLPETDHVVACITVPFLKGSNTIMTIIEAEKHVKKAAEELSELSRNYAGF